MVGTEFSKSRVSYNVFSTYVPANDPSTAPNVLMKNKSGEAKNTAKFIRDEAVTSLIA